MEELIYVYLGLASAAFILCLLALIISRRQAKKHKQAPAEKKPEPEAEPAEEAPQEAKPAAAKATAPGEENLDQIIQSAFGSMEKGDYSRASQAFQTGLKMTTDPRVTVQLHLELAKIYNIAEDREKAIKHLDQALELAQTNRNGATEQELLRIKQMIISQPSP